MGNGKDRSVITGLALGLIILVGALLLGHVPLQTLLNPEALLIVFGGTLTATLISFDLPAIGRAIRSLNEASPESALQTHETVGYVMDVVGFVRDEGILALQPILESVEIPFFKKGLQHVLDNRSERFIRESLSTEIEVIYREETDHARVFETAGGYAPTMGIIGAVIGLIYTVQAFSDPSQLGQGVASAFSATLYGVSLSNLFLLPLAAKLRQRSRYDAFIRTLLLEAVLSIRSGEHPMLIEERLNAFSGGASEGKSGYASKPSKSYDSAPIAIPAAKAVMQDDFMRVN